MAGVLFSNEALNFYRGNMSGLLPFQQRDLDSQLKENATMNYNDPTLTSVRFLFEAILTLSVSLLGLAGNTISLGILYRMKKRKLCSVATLLQILAVVDILILLNNCALRPFKYILINTGYLSVHAFMFPFLFPSTYTLSFINTWLTVILSWNRYQAVCNPLAAYTHPRGCRGNRNPYSQCFALVLLALLVNMPRYFEYRIGYVEKLQRHSFQLTGLMGSNTYMIGYRFVVFLLSQYFVPIGLLIFFNFKIISSLQNNAMAKVCQEGGMSSSNGTIRIFVAKDERKHPGDEGAGMFGIRGEMEKKIKDANGDRKKAKSKKSRSRYKSLSESTTTTTTTTFAPLSVQPTPGQMNSSSSSSSKMTTTAMMMMLMARGQGEGEAFRGTSGGSVPGAEAADEIVKSERIYVDMRLSSSPENHSSSCCRRRSQPQRQSAQATAVIAVTRMVLVVVVMSTVCSVFTSGAHILQIVQLSGYPELDMFRRFYTVISNLFGTVNHSFNFVAYCLSSKNFRLIFHSWIQQSFAKACCCLGRK